jgi:hypothetical protein
MILHAILPSLAVQDYPFFLARQKGNKVRRGGYRDLIRRMKGKQRQRAKALVAEAGSSIRLFFGLENLTAGGVMYRNLESRHFAEFALVPKPRSGGLCLSNHRLPNREKRALQRPCLNTGDPAVMHHFKRLPDFVR